jgi:hypothetical protein
MAEKAGPTRPAFSRSLSEGGDRRAQRLSAEKTPTTVIETQSRLAA